eukprot:TRINITY_DN484_c0_g1_i1.p2 TRINITY_DN484_c0_g1~~TRINITY_DN484_c0_g1_i1.p2  ORF type:complete len:194 (+),score=37.53 TRINITY_DN484_c0_g1_i1:159-740(+)
MQEQLYLDVCNMKQQLKVFGLETVELPPQTQNKLQIICEVCQTMQCTPQQVQQLWVKKQMENMVLQSNLLEFKQMIQKMEVRNAAGSNFLEDLKSQRSAALQQMEDQKDYILSRQNEMKFAAAEVESLKNEVSNLQNKISGVDITQEDVLQKKQQLDENCKQIKLLEKELERYEGLTPDINSAKQAVEKLQKK